MTARGRQRPARLPATPCNCVQCLFAAARFPADPLQLAIPIFDWPVQHAGSDPKGPSA